MISKQEIKIRSDIPQLVDVLPPTGEPLGVQDYLNYGNIGTNKQIANLADKLVFARERFEQWTGQRVLTQTLDQIVDYDPRNNPNGIPFYISEAVGEIRLRASPVRSIVYIYVRDPFGVETLVDPLVYILQTVRDPYALLTVQLGKVWPGVLRDIQAIRIRTISGYATPITSIDTSTGIITAPGHPYQDGDLVNFSMSYGLGSVPPTMPAGLSAYTNYYALAPSGDTLQVSTTLDGSPVAITTQGSGQIFAGRIPKQILRGIMITAAADLNKDESDESSSESAQDIPKKARQMWRRYKRSWV